MVDKCLAMGTQGLLVSGVLFLDVILLALFVKGGAFSFSAAGSCFLPPWAVTRAFIRSIIPSIAAVEK